MNHEIILQNIQRQKTYFPPEAKPERKTKKYTCHCIFVFSFTQRAITNKQKLHTTTRPLLRRRIITCCMQKQKFKKKAGELITHHPFVDDVGRTILSHHHQWCSSSCFPTWEVQILEHSPTQRKASLACGPRFRYEQTATTNHSALSSDLLWPNDNTLMHDDPGTVHVVFGDCYHHYYRWKRSSDHSD